VGQNGARGGFFRAVGFVSAFMAGFGWLASVVVILVCLWASRGLHILAIGRPSPVSRTLPLAAGMQNAILRNGRLKICATLARVVPAHVTSHYILAGQKVSGLGQGEAETKEKAEKLKC
jgi:hypothetical protein